LKRVRVWDSSTHNGRTPWKISQADAHSGSLADIRPRPGPFAILFKEISGPSQRKIQVVFKADADPAAIVGAALVLANRRIHPQMEDKFKRIAVVALDIGIIALMLVSLVWNAPAFKMQENSEPALAKTFDDRWAE